jgi:hypothetical protein
MDNFMLCCVELNSFRTIWMEAISVLYSYYQNIVHIPEVACYVMF